MASYSVIRAATKCHTEKRRWALSGASRPGESAEEVAEHTSSIRSYRQMSVGVAGDLRVAGFPVFWDTVGAHVQIDLPGSPDEAMCASLRDLMPARKNPHFRGEEQR